MTGAAGGDRSAVVSVAPKKGGRRSSSYVQIMLKTISWHHTRAVASVVAYARKTVQYLCINILRKFTPVVWVGKYDEGMTPCQKLYIQ